jgi:hypothetical protein
MIEPKPSNAIAAAFTVVNVCKLLEQHRRVGRFHAGAKHTHYALTKGMEYAVTKQRVDVAATLLVLRDGHKVEENGLVLLEEFFENAANLECSEASFRSFDYTV